ncbi:MAG: hypothetical protein ACLUBZ_15535 [Ruthenibacterium lactatiformans]|uniref:hypothetical protein n=1 Tax=Ruthenibacterium lactatiformans TaxID=1550024 RepID=UPI0039950792
MSKNYEITNIAHPQDTKLHRIRALKALRHDVFSGDLGGFVQSEENLAQDEECWIYGDAIACGNSCVAQKGALYENACIRDFALVCGSAQMHGESQAEDRAIVRAGILTEQASVTGDGFVGEDATSGNAPVLKGQTLVYGEVSGKVLCQGKTVILPGQKLTNTSPDRICLCGQEISVERAARRNREVLERANDEKKAKKRSGLER